MIKSIAKLLLSPRRANFKPQPRQTPIVILGNGPSLNETMAHHAERLAELPLMAVNFAAITPQFARLKPEYYVLADPHFFRNSADPNVKRLQESLASVDWSMTLLTPFGANPQIANPKVTVRHFPMTAIEGPTSFCNAIFSARLGMPRPRNVMIPAIMAAIWLGFTQIYICGADHTWLTTLSVNERNEVVSIQPHFYKDSEEELERQRVDYLRLPLHQVLESMTIAFRSYHEIARWAKTRGVEIYNATPGSFIDAFPRKQL